MWKSMFHEIMRHVHETIYKQDLKGLLLELHVNWSKMLVR